MRIISRIGVGVVAGIAVALLVAAIISAATGAGFREVAIAGVAGTIIGAITAALVGRSGNQRRRNSRRRRTPPSE